LLWSYEDAEWVALAFEKITGRTPELPWRLADLDRVLIALGALATALRGCRECFTSAFMR
jgi:hypothetical protein